MDDRNLNIELDELFRKKLESAELTPGDLAGRKLMRRLGRKEFVRFNPARFNVYYLGGIIAAGIAATLLLTRNPDDKQKEYNNNPVINEVTIPGNVSESVTGAREDDVKPEVLGENISANESGKEKETSESVTHAGSRTISNNVTDQKTARILPDTLHKNTYLKEKITRDNLGEVAIQKKPFSEFISSSVSGCLPLKVRFINRSLSYDSCRWSFGDGGYSTARDSEWIFDVPGEYKVTLRVYGANGTESESVETITVHPKPVASFIKYPEKPILPDDAISFVNNSRDAVKYKWEFGDGRTSDAFEPEHRYSRYNNYTIRLIAWSQFGCADTITVKNAFSVSGCYIDFPNAFIPNPDGPAGGYYSNKSDESAQIFHPVTSGVSDYQLRIFSKTGYLIFESNDINIGWDGYNKGKLCEPGVYVWKVRGTFKNGETFVKMGDVTIIKN